MSTNHFTKIIPLSEYSGSAAHGRESYWNNQYALSAEIFVNLFEANPNAWWFALEALRSIRLKSRLEKSSSNTKQLIFSPLYAGNTYQNNFYSEQKSFGYCSTPVDRLVLDDKLALLTAARGSFFHQHWLKELYWSATSISAGIKEIDRHIGILKAIGCFGTSIVWTLHNLIDHDASDMQVHLCQYALKSMAAVSDAIFIHTKGAGEQLAAIYGGSLSHKFHLLPHPLYDDLLEKVLPQVPPEVNAKLISDRRVLLSAGMIRPYKGIPDLIEAFTLLSKPDSFHLIIAGHCSDIRVEKLLSSLPHQLRGCITYIPRKLSDSEMVGLMNLSDVCVTPYKRILTSGSFYLTTTFRKPTIAPNIGMFCESIRHLDTGFLYDGSVHGLASILALVQNISSEELRNVGERVYQEHKSWTVNAASTKLFEILEQLN